MYHALPGASTKNAGMTAEGLAIILVEQHVELALALTDAALILDRGRIAHAAASSALLRDRGTLERLVGLRLEDDAREGGAAGGRNAAFH